MKLYIEFLPNVHSYSSKCDNLKCSWHENGCLVIDEGVDSVLYIIMEDPLTERLNVVGVLGSELFMLK